MNHYDQYRVNTGTGRTTIRCSTCQQPIVINPHATDTNRIEPGTLITTLLAAINTHHSENHSTPGAPSTQDASGFLYNVLADLHARDNDGSCQHCSNASYTAWPCETIQAADDALKTWKRFTIFDERPVTHIDATNYENEILNLKEEISNLREINDELSATIDLARETMAGRQTTIDNLHESVATLGARYDELKTESGFPASNIVAIDSHGGLGCGLRTFMISDTDNNGRRITRITPCCTDIAHSLGQVSDIISTMVTHGEGK